MVHVELSNVHIYLQAVTFLPGTHVFKSTCIITYYRKKVNVFFHSLSNTGTPVKDVFAFFTF